MVCTICLSSNNKHLFCGGSFGDLKWFDARRQKLIKDFGEVHAGSITILKLAKNETILFSASSHGDLKVWSLDLENFANEEEADIVLIKELNDVHENGIYSLDATSDFTTFFTGGKDKVLKQWDTTSYEITKTY